VEIFLYNRENKSHLGLVNRKEIVVQYFRYLKKEVCVNAFAVEDAVNVGAVKIQFLGKPRD
jgi:hypothetical protein